jgi:hypothetical protein
MLEVKPCDLPADAQEFRAGDGPGQIERLKQTAGGRYALARSLSTMRETITRNTDARIVLGGKLIGFAGLLPGIVEEVLFAIRKKQPLFIAGGFGGAAHLVASAIDGKHPTHLTREYQESLGQPYSETLRFYEDRGTQFDLDLSDVDYGAVAVQLEGYGVNGLAVSNGLSADENCELFSTGSVDVAVYLTMKGLSTIAK